VKRTAASVVGLFMTGLSLNVSMVHPSSCTVGLTNRSSPSSSRDPRRALEGPARAFCVATGMACTAAGLEDDGMNGGSQARRPVVDVSSSRKSTRRAHVSRFDLAHYLRPPHCILRLSYTLTFYTLKIIRALDTSSPDEETCLAKRWTCARRRSRITPILRRYCTRVVPSPAPLADIS